MMKRVLSIVLALAMIVTVISINPTEANAKVTIQSGKKITLTIGKSEKIYVKQKGATFKTSNKKVATVSKKGVVKAIAPGKCKITIKVGSSKATSKVTVNLANVKITSAEPISVNGAKLTWKKVKGAKGYYVYRSTKKSSGYKKVATVKKTNATIKNLALGYTHYFKVKAYNAKKKVSAKYSNVKSVKTYKLVWSDEFNGTSLDMSNWTYETGHGQNGWGNQELQDYKAGNNIKFENGNLVIIPRWVKKSGMKDEITSTRIKSKGKREFKYGRMEIRAKAAKGKGTWSAGWMLGDGTGDSRGWPYDGEIDILEAMNGGVPQTIHCEYFNNQYWSHGNKNYQTGLTQAQCAEKYHTYGIIWTEKYIQFTVDGVNKGKYDPSIYSKSIYDKVWGGEFDHPFFFILNCAIGGNAAGQVDLNDGWTLVKNTATEKVYEDYFYIDYVRVYQ